MKLSTFLIPLLILSFSAPLAQAKILSRDEANIIKRETDILDLYQLINSPKKESTSDIKKAERIIKKHKLNLNEKIKQGSYEGYYLIIEAAKADKKGMIDMLLKNEADIAIGEKRVYGAAASALNMAANKGYFELVKFLLKKGAPTFSQSKASCLDAVCHGAACDWSHNKETVQDIALYILQNCVDVRKYGLQDALARAVESNNEGLVKILLENGADEYIHKAGICPSSGSAILKAAGGGNVNIAKMLLEKGANINDLCKDSHGNDQCSALHLAAYYPYPPMISFFLDKGLDINRQNGSGQTALMIAAKFGRVDTLNLLLENNADFDIEDSKGLKALDYAKTSMLHKEETFEYGFRFDKKGAKKCYEILSDLTAKLNTKRKLTNIRFQKK